MKKYKARIRAKKEIDGYVKFYQELYRERDKQQEETLWADIHKGEDKLVKKFEENPPLSCKDCHCVYYEKKQKFCEHCGAELQKESGEE